MPAEIIDLLSSPEPTIPKVVSHNATTSQLEQYSKTGSPPRKHMGSVWCTLSSDEEVEIDLPPSKSSSKIGGIANAEPNGQFSKSTSRSSMEVTRPMSISTNNDELSSYSKPKNSAINPTASSLGILGLNRKQMEEERLARINKKKLAVEKGLPETHRKVVRDVPTSQLQDLLSDDPFDFVDRSTNERGLPASANLHIETVGLPSLNTNTNGFKKREPLAPLLISSDNDPFELDVPSSKKRKLSPDLPSKLMEIRQSGFQRSISNIETSSKLIHNNSRASGLPRSKSRITETDPIVFTSSPDFHAEAANRRRKKSTHTMGEDEDIFELGTSQNFPQERWSGKGGSYDNSSDSLPDINIMVSKNAAKTTKAAYSSIQRSDVLERYQADKKKDKKIQEKAQEKSQKARDREQKAKEKKDEKERKRTMKEDKAREKETAAFLEKANTLKTDKKVSTPEMIVHLPSSLEHKVRHATRVFLNELSVTTYEYDSDLPIIKWERKTEAIWDPEARIFRPCQLEIKEENHILYVMSAKEFVQLVIDEEGKNLDSHVLRLRSRFESREIIYLIEGLANWMRKNKSIKNRGFTEAVRSQMNSVELTASQRPKKTKDAQYVDEDLVEHALLRLQVMHGVLIHHSLVVENTPEWIRSFTQHISTIPYK